MFLKDNNEVCVTICGDASLHFLLLKSSMPCHFTKLCLIHCPKVLSICLWFLLRQFEFSSEILEQKLWHMLGGSKLWVVILKIIWGDIFVGNHVYTHTQACRACIVTTLSIFINTYTHNNFCVILNCKYLLYGWL